MAKNAKTTPATKQPEPEAGAAAQEVPATAASGVTPAAGGDGRDSEVQPETGAAQEVPATAASGVTPGAGGDGRDSEAQPEAGAAAQEVPATAASGVTPAAGGEAGPEAIMPLRRGPDGRLGVTAARGVTPAAGGDGRDSEARAYPLLFAAAEAWRAAGHGRPPLFVRVAARLPGFRRAGMAHPKEPTDHPVDAFSPDELEALLGEPNLIVEFAAEQLPAGETAER